MDVDQLLALPRSVLLALWLEHISHPVGPGRPDRDAVLDAVTAVQGDDEPHQVSDGVGRLDRLVADWSSGPVHTCAVLPVPGDVTGVPAAVSASAVDAGEVLLVHRDGRSWAAVPEVERFGSVYEPGHLVTWHVHEVPDWRHVLTGTVGTLTEAERALRLGLQSATEALAALDVARWRPDAAHALAALRADTAQMWDLPPGVEPRRLRVLVLAARLRAIVAVAVSDDGGAVNLWQADQRSAALREVDVSARRAMVAATFVHPSTER